MTRIEAIKQMKGASNKDAILVNEEYIQYWDITFSLDNLTNEEIEALYDYEIEDKEEDNER